MRRDLFGVDRVVALGAFESELRRCVLALKYANRRDIADHIAAIFACKIAVLGDMLVPVPLHPSRLERRGYNQAGVLAAALAQQWSAQDRAGILSLCPNALRRVKPTAPQSGLDLDKRRGNIEDAFRPGEDAAHVSGRRVILVDDVVTTGATLAACARVLRACGAAHVAAACAAATL